MPGSGGGREERPVIERRDDMEIQEAVNALRAAAGGAADTGAEEVYLTESAGRVLYEDISAPFNVPDFNRSAMDGYAVRAEDTVGALPERKVALKVAGAHMAGDYTDAAYTQRTAFRVMTGAYVPDGYDAVVKQEDTDYGESEVGIFREITAGVNYSPAGEDIKKGETVLKKGMLLTCAAVGIMASLGMEKVRVKRPIGVSLISTGSEVLLPGQRLTHGKIYNNSAYIMASMIKKAALKVSDVSAVGDDLQLICGAIGEKAGASNIVITTGGVSVGKKDLMPEVLEKMGAQILFRGVDIQPGTPTIGAKLGDRILLCLSGNPFAALANFEVYFWEAAAALMGCDGLRPETGRAVMDSDYKKKNLHTRLIRAFVKDGRAYLPQSVHASSVVSNLISCNCMIELEKGRSLKAGDEVKIRYTH